ncbi:MAG: M28 family peptidase [Myxococcales bacterium]|nr:M28 family peptidase [Myxococcales bacterium]
MTAGLRHGWVAVCLGLVFLLVAWRSGPRPTAATGFDVERALFELRAVLGDEIPRPMGSAASEAVRARLARRLEGLGLAPSVQRQTVCDGGTCGTVHNLFAEVSGPPGAPLVLLVAHSDSVSAGPGLADDGHGMAIVLEAVRLASEADAPRNALGVLITDGEEVGLLGARAFVSDHPEMARVAAVVNVEARGTGGPSYLFETSQPNGWLTRTAMASMAEPNASSLFFEVYRRLPNDTDLTVFKEAGVHAVNFAFLDGVHRYHTPLDDWSHLDRSSVQDQGDAAVAAWLALGSADFAAATDTNDVYADVLGVVVLRWPEAWARPLALAVLLWVCGLGAVGLSRSEGGWRPAAVGLLVVPLWGVAVVGACVGLQEGLRLAGATWTGWPWPLRLGLWGMCLGSLLATASLWARVEGWARFMSVWGWMGVLGVAVALEAPGASYLWVAPVAWACGMATLGLLTTGDDVGSWPWALGGSLLALVFWLQLALRLEAAVGLSALTVALPLVLALTTLVPTLAPLTPRIGLAGMGGALGVASATLLAPAATAERPATLSVTHVQQGDDAVWLAASSRPPEGFAPASDVAGPRSPLWAGAWARAADPRDELDVIVDVESSARTTLRLRSARGARGLGWMLPSPHTRLWVAGRPVEHRGVLYHAGGADVLEVQLEASEAVGGLWAFDVLDLEAADVPQGLDAVPVHRGHRSIRLRHVSLAPH